MQADASRENDTNQSLTRKSSSSRKPRHVNLQQRASNHEKQQAKTASSNDQQQPGSSERQSTCTGTSPHQRGPGLNMSPYKAATVHKATKQLMRECVWGGGGGVPPSPAQSTLAS